jgi:hypothetical protein
MPCGKKCHCCKPVCGVFFYNDPCPQTWRATDGEVTIFEKKYLVDKDANILVDASIAAEISPSTISAYNTYKLYINDEVQSRGGYEAEGDLFDPNLETSSLIWGGSFACSCTSRVCLKVRVTAQLQVPPPEGPGPVPIYASNIDNNVGNFKGAKGAHLRVYIN